MTPRTRAGRATLTQSRQRAALVAARRAAWAREVRQWRDWIICLSFFVAVAVIAMGRPS
jgi:hypothetical protein